MRRPLNLLCSAAIILMTGVITPHGQGALPLERLTLPAGFSIAVWAEVENPRQLAIDNQGVVYAGTRRAGKLHALADLDQDGIADWQKVIAEGLNLPSGVAVKGDTLYIGDVSTIYALQNLRDIRTDKTAVLKPIYSGFPSEKHHGWKFIAFGPDGKLYVPVGAPCNICLSDDERFASILTMDVDQPDRAPSIFARGVRNSVGFDWHPETGALWFTDNGRDRMGDDTPSCELNIAPAPGLHFGYPFVHDPSVLDPEFGGRAGDLTFESAAVSLGPHVAPVGMTFYQGESFPEAYQNQALIALHGSWNRSQSAGHTGYQVVMIEEKEGRLQLTPFIDGWLQNNRAWGRPADLLTLPDGSLLISDDFANVIYRVTFNRAS